MNELSPVNPSTRTDLLRERLKTLYPASTLNRPIPKGTTPTKAEPKRKPGKRWSDFPAECSPKAKHQAKFVTVPDEPAPIVVRPQRERGPSPLTVIGEKFKERVVWTKRL